MANVKITELTAATALAGTDVLPIVDVGADATKKVSVSDLLRNLPDGTASAPALAFADDQNTGVLSPGNNSLAFATSGTQRLVIDSSGRVGIGTTNPGSLLHLSASSPRLTLTDTDTGVDHRLNADSGVGNFAFDVDYNSEATSPSVVFNLKGSEKLRINSSGQVGIGTTSPRALVDFGPGSGDGTLSQTLSQYQAVFEAPQGTGDIGRNIAFATTTTGISAAINATDEGGGSATGIAFATGTAGSISERLRIIQNGRVGIGTSSPDKLLHLAGADTAIIRLENTDTSLTADQIIGGLEFEKRDGSGAGAGVVGGLRMYSEGAVGESAYLTLSTASSSTNNAERMRIDSSGRVGIGTTSPQTITHVFGANPILRIQDSSTSIADGFAAIQLAESGSGGSLNNYWQIALEGDSGTSTDHLTFKDGTGERMRIDSSGRLLVGETHAIADFSNNLLNISHASGAGIQIGRKDTSVSANNVIGSIQFRTDTGSGANYQSSASIEVYAEDTHAAGDSPGRLTFSTTADGASSPTERLRIDSSGRVGIGITNPEDRLDLGAGYIRFKQAIGGTGTYGAIRAFNTLVGSPATSIRFIRDVATVGNDGAICFDTVNSERARIDSSGRMLVGTTTAFGGNSEMLQIARNGGGAIALLRNDTSVSSGNELGAISWYGNDATASNYQECATIRAIADGTHGDNDKPSRLAFSTTQNNTGSVTERMRIGQDGTTQIFSSGSTNTLTSRNGSGAGTTYACFIGQHSSTGMGTGTTSIHIGTNGNVRNTNNSYGSLSDIKLKENIVDCGSQWDDIKDIRVRKYNFKASTNHETFTQLGVIAQEVETVSPGLVTDSPDLDGEGNDLGTTTKSVNYSVLYMKAVKALQEAMDRIETLEAKVAALEAQ